jgi:hypothetical protein
VALAVLTVTAAFWIGSDTPDTPPRENTAQKILRRRLTSPAPSKPVVPQGTSLLDPVDMETRRAEGRQVADEAAKEAAWAAEWQVSPDCEHPVDWTAQVECGNRYIRTRRAFEGKWNAQRATGKLLSTGE